MAFDDIFGDLTDDLADEDINPMPMDNVVSDENNTNDCSWDTGKPSSIWTIGDDDVWSTNSFKNN